MVTSNDRDGSTIERPNVDSSETPPTTSSEFLELDHVYKALGHSRRRYLCYTLLESPEWTPGDLARKIAAWEHDVAEADVTDQQQEAVYIALYHMHVPTLVEEGVIAFDSVIETIGPATNAKQVLRALKGIDASLDSQQEAHARSDSHE